jgi:O-antigen ligase
MALLPIERKSRPLVALIVLIALGALLVGTVASAALSLDKFLALVAAVGVLCLFLVRQDELTGAISVAIAIVVDYYQIIPLPIFFPAIATVIAGAGVLIIYLSPSADRPWVPVRYLWIWVLILLLQALDIPLSSSPAAALHYYVVVIFNAALGYVLGTQFGTDISRLKKLLIPLAVLASVIAIHGIIESTTGNFLFLTPSWASWLAVENYYILFGTNQIRAGSFLINPDDFGTYCSVMLPILLGLVVAAKSVRGKVLASVGAFLVSLALLFTFSTAAWIATAVGVFAALVLIARGWARLYLPTLILAVMGLLAVAFQGAVQVLIAHATAPRELGLRIGAWLTGLNVIQHNPLIGVGLGYSNYVARSIPYRSPQQDIALSHPHNSFLEVAAFGGVPTGILYIAVLLLVIWQAFGNYRRAHAHDKVLIGSILVAVLVLTVNSLATAAWTFQPVALLAWMILGAAASPYLLSRRDATSATADDAGGTEQAALVTLGTTVQSAETAGGQA